jgi:hypothetical protein
MKPDIQYFASSGTWVKPAGAVAVDVLLCGAGSGASGLNDGEDGQFRVQRVAADELADEMHVEVGKGGRPGGRDGYALIVTHLSEDQASTPASSAWDKVERDLSVITAGDRDAADVLAEVRRRSEAAAR